MKNLKDKNSVINTLFGRQKFKKQKLNPKTNIYTLFIESFSQYKKSLLVKFPAIRIIQG